MKADDRKYWRKSAALLIRSRPGGLSSGTSIDEIGDIELVELVHPSVPAVAPLMPPPAIPLPPRPQVDLAAALRSGTGRPDKASRGGTTANRQGGKWVDGAVAQTGAQTVCLRFPIPFCMFPRSSPVTDLPTRSAGARETEPDSSEAAATAGQLDKKLTARQQVEQQVCQPLGSWCYAITLRAPTQALDSCSTGARLRRQLVSGRRRRW